MSILTATSASHPRSVVQRARWFLLAFHLPIVVTPPIRVLTFAGSADTLSQAALVGLAALALGGLQLRHSFAAARGERPRWWPWTLAALSAVALKGDLAGRLLRSDPSGAWAEIVGLTGVARDALRSITHDEQVVSLRTEVDGAAALLRAADIDASVDLALGDLPPAIDAVLAWTVREGITNLLRHADARRCSIVGTRHGGSVRLEILNDGVRTVADDPSGQGSGLAGLTERANAVHGSLSATRGGDGSFRLLVEVPEIVA